MRLSAAFVLVLALLAACSPEPSGTPSTPSSSPPAATSTAVVPSSNQPSLAARDWTETFSRQLFTLGDVVQGHSGFIAPGCVADVHGSCLQGVLLTSPDGVSWTQLELEGAEGTWIRPVRKVGNRLFALGQWYDGAGGKIEPVVWTSVEGGSWSRVPTAASRNRSITDVIEAPVGNIAVGIHTPIDSEGSGFVVWHLGPDGSFGKPRDVTPDSGLGFVVGAAWAGDRFLAWGPCECSPADNVRSTRLMASPDGKAWTVLPDIAAFHDSTVSAMLHLGERLVAIGYEGRSIPTSPKAWTSVNGETWEAADVPTDDGGIYTIRIEGSRLVARGVQYRGSEESPATWTSIDGEVWARVPAGEDTPDLAGFSALGRAVVDGRACVAGTFSGDPRRPEPRAAIYCRPTLNE